MTAPASTAVTRRILRALLATTLLLVAFTGCNQESGDPSRQTESLKADVDESKRRASALQNTLASKDAELVGALTTLETTKAALAEKEHTLVERDKELRTARIELDALKKNEGLIFAEIAAAQQKGQPTIARVRFEKFVVDFPNSPLVPAANAAIAQLSEVPREVSRQMDIIDPKRKERAFQKTFSEGYMTLQELGPILKKKSLTQVLTLLGRPNQTFNSGTELGYDDRAINPLTGTRGMLVIGFEASTVANLRVEYAGKKYAP
jgi:septal ring factor EnvC (AmiA/AmiB activator)